MLLAILRLKDEVQGLDLCDQADLILNSDVPDFWRDGGCAACAQL